MSALEQDLRYALRQLRSRPAFTAAAVLTLAIGIGACTAMFSVVNAVLLRPLPFAEPQRLVVLSEANPAYGVEREDLAAETVDDWRRDVPSLDGIALWIDWGLTLRGEAEPEEIPTVRASANLFALLGVAPSLGRGFLPEEGQPGGARVVVASHGFWAARLGADPAAVGRTLILDDEPYTVVGVMPAGFRFPDDATVGLWTPLVYHPFETRSRAQRMFNGLARLAPGATLADARAELATVSTRLATDFPGTNRGWIARAVPAAEVSSGSAREPLLVLLGAVGCVLLIACANVGNLFLVRGVERERELAVRVAMGAARGRLVRQLLTEVLVVAAAGAALGLLLAWWGVDAVLALNPGHLPQWNPVRIDATVLAFTAGLVGVAAVVAGLAPALTAARPELARSLQGVRTSAGPTRRRLRHALVVSQVALSLGLLASAALMIKSLDRLLRVDPGFDPDGVLTATIYLTDRRYPDNARQAAFFAALLERVRQLPGVEAAGAVTTLPFSTMGIDHDMPVAVVNGPPPDVQKPEADFRIASPGYFEAMRIPLIAGRAFGQQDHAAAPPVVIVNQAFVDRFMQGLTPLDQRVRWGRTGPVAQVVGVLASLRHRGFDDVARPEIYVPYQQLQYGSMTLAVRTAGDPLAVAEAVKQSVFSIDAAQPVTAIVPLADLMRASTAERRFNMSVLVAFAALALGLAAVGLYGVVSTLVTQRTREIGVRLALGAPAGTVFGHVLGDGLRLAGAGIAAGAMIALGFTRLLRNLLFQVPANDPVGLGIAALVLVIVAAVACALPALRATRVDPMTALRTE